MIVRDNIFDKFCAFHAPFRSYKLLDTLVSIVLYESITCFGSFVHCFTYFGPICCRVILTNCNKSAYLRGLLCGR